MPTTTKSDAMNKAQIKLAALEQIRAQHASLVAQLGLDNLSSDWEPPSYPELLDEHYEETLYKMEEPA